MVIDFSFEANKYFNDSEPWVLKKKDPNRMETILFTISHQIKNISILLSPIIPEASNKVFKIMNLSLNDLKVDKINDMKIIVPMAGRGSRLRPQTFITPKPLIHVAGKSILEQLLSDVIQLIDEPVKEIIFII